MRELLERAVLIGLGLASLTQEKAKAWADELTKRGELRREEIRRWVDDLVARGEKSREELRKMLREEVRKALKEMGLATREDIEALHRLMEEKGK